MHTILVSIAKDRCFDTWRWYTSVLSSLKISVMFCYTELHILLKNSILTLILSFLLLSFISSELIFQKKKTILCCIQRVAQRKFSWLFEGFHPRNKIFKIKLRWPKTQLPTPLQMVARLLIVTDRNEFKPLEKSYQATGKKTLPSFFLQFVEWIFFSNPARKRKLTVLSRINFYSEAMK